MPTNPALPETDKQFKQNELHEKFQQFFSELKALGHTFSDIAAVAATSAHELHAQAVAQDPNTPPLPANPNQSDDAAQPRVTPSAGGIIRPATPVAPQTASVDPAIQPVSVPSPETENTTSSNSGAKSATTASTSGLKTVQAPEDAAQPGTTTDTNALNAAKTGSAV